MADCRHQYMCLFWFPPNCREQFSQASPVVELTYYYPYSYCVGPVADVDVQCFAKHTHSLSKTRRLLSQQFTSCVHNQRVILGQYSCFILKPLSADTDNSPRPSLQIIMT